MRSYSAWKEEYDGSHDAPIDEDSMWANLAYFLQAVVPVAEEAGVRLALHPEDPLVLESLGQAAHITSTLDQYERENRQFNVIRSIRFFTQFRTRKYNLVWRRLEQRFGTCSSPRCTRRTSTSCGCATA